MTLPLHFALKGKTGIDWNMHNILQKSACIEFYNTASENIPKLALISHDA